MSRVLTEMESMEQEFHDKNFDVTLSVDTYVNTKYIPENGEGTRRIIGTKNDSKIAQNDHLDGVAPMLENEIAITGMMAEAYRVGKGKQRVTTQYGLHKYIRAEKNSTDAFNSIGWCKRRGIEKHASFLEGNLSILKKMLL